MLSKPALCFCFQAVARIGANLCCLYNKAEEQMKFLSVITDAKWGIKLGKLGASQSEADVSHLQCFYFHIDYLLGTSYSLGLDILADHSDIHPAGVPSAARNEEKPDSSAAEEQENHPRHHHPVLQVNFCLFVCFCPLFSLLSCALKFILSFLFAAVPLV